MLPAQLEQNASRAFWLLVTAHVVAWTFLPALTQANAPLDVIEGFAWGREWVLGTYKHPPLQAWLLELAARLFGTHPIGYFGLSALCGGITLWAVYCTARLFTTRAQAFLATLLTQSLFYVSILAAEFNPNVLQLMLASLSGYAFAHAMLRHRLKFWLLLGFFMALGLYAKYSMALFGFSFLLFMLTQRETRPLLFRPPAFMALALCFIILLPHLLWLQSHDFAPFAYAAGRAEQAQYWWQHLFFPVKFLSAQMLAMLGTLGLAALVLLPLRVNVTLTGLRARLLFWLAWGPLLLVLLLSALTGEKPRDMWGMPLLTFIPLWLLNRFTLQEGRLKLFMSAAVLLFLLTLGAFAANQLLAPAFGIKPLRGHFPGRALGAYMHGQWQQRYAAPLDYVAGDAWLAGNVAFYGPDTARRAHVWIDASPTTSPWISYEKVKAHGAIALWRIHDDPAPPAWLGELEGAQLQPPAFFPWAAGVRAKPVAIGWAIIPPAAKIQ